MINSIKTVVLIKKEMNLYLVTKNVKFQENEYVRVNIEICTSIRVSECFLEYSEGNHQIFSKT